MRLLSTSSYRLSGLPNLLNLSIPWYIILCRMYKVPSQIHQPNLYLRLHPIGYNITERFDWVPS